MNVQSGLWQAPVLERLTALNTQHFLSKVLEEIKELAMGLASCFPGCHIWHFFFPSGLNSNQTNDL